MHVPRGSARSQTRPDAPDETALLEALAEVGDRLTVAIVHRDHDEIRGATVEAEGLVDRLAGLDPDAAGPEPGAHVTALAARIGAAARRNALLLERAWITDAAVLRLLAQAARAETETAGAGAYAQPSADPGQPVGWLDRSA